MQIGGPMLRIDFGTSTFTADVNCNINTPSKWLDYSYSVNAAAVGNKANKYSVLDGWNHDELYLMQINASDSDCTGSVCNGVEMIATHDVIYTNTISITYPDGSSGSAAASITIKWELQCSVSTMSAPTPNFSATFALDPASMPAATTHTIPAFTATNSYSFPCTSATEVLTYSPSLPTTFISVSGRVVSIGTADTTAATVIDQVITVTSTITNADSSTATATGYTITGSLTRTDCASGAATLADISELPQAPSTLKAITLPRKSKNTFTVTTPSDSLGGKCGTVTCTPRSGDSSKVTLTA